MVAVYLVSAFPRALLYLLFSIVVSLLPCGACSAAHHNGSLFIVFVCTMAVPRCLSPIVLDWFYLSLGPLFFFFFAAAVESRTCFIRYYDDECVLCILVLPLILNNICFCMLSEENTVVFHYLQI